MKRFFWVLAGLLAFVPALASEKDSLVRVKDLKFTSSFEKDSYSSHLNSKTDYLNLFLANAPEPESYAKYFNEKINATVKEIRGSGMLGKKNAKKIKYIYDLVHKGFLTKYETENRFYEIMKNGNYNCVTATALFAIIFEKLDIPYRIVELPTHVFLVAYPDADNIRLETTAPVFGFNAYSDEFKAQFVNTLKKQKLIAANDATLTDELFNKHFYGSESVSLSELVGIHYLNDGIYHQTREEKAEAFEQISKAYLLYPSERTEYLLLLSSADRLSDTKLDPLTRAAIIGLISRSGTSFFTSENIVAEFHRLTNQVLEKENDRDLYAKCFAITMSSVKDPDLAGELTYYFYHENGRIFYNQGNYMRAKPYFRKALETRPRSSEMAATLISCLGQTFRNERRNLAILDTLLVYNAQFPVMSEHPTFVSMLAMAYAGHFGDCFDKNDAVNGEKNRLMFEDIVGKESIPVMSEELVSRAYSVAAAYYFKRGQKSKAKAIIDRGLEIIPNNYQLRTTKQMLN